MRKLVILYLLFALSGCNRDNSCVPIHCENEESNLDSTSRDFQSNLSLQSSLYSNGIDTFDLEWAISPTYTSTETLVCDPDCDGGNYTIISEKNKVNYNGSYNMSIPNCLTMVKSTLEGPIFIYGSFEHTWDSFGFIESTALIEYPFDFSNLSNYTLDSITLLGNAYYDIYKFPIQNDTFYFDSVLGPISLPNNPGYYRIP